MSVDEGRLGVLPLSGCLHVIVDNHDPWKPEKWIRLQLTWRPQDPGEYPIICDLDPLPIDPPVIIEEVIIGDGWVETTYDWYLDWNPPDESFNIMGTINVDEVVIDTWCIPEPATMSLLALGAAGLLIRRRR
jgi:hypothetical protein